ncbi:hypothetical protein CXB51_002847 [Gossypium anomalum]|uniref:Integrase catalytic domain-containing protein n=1 Tax=Gossypium anomalum TaxID=47600 RepID=A0A8J6D6T9_9ROSI|nr:hypothetical protein CXB51_002847 [Gossypium anomalum]
MATTHSADSDSVEPTGSVFLGDSMVTSFPRHEVVKLDADSFIQWQQQIRLIPRGYGLLGFLDGTLIAPPRFVQSLDGALVTNPSASIFDQQDNLLTSWLLSTISSSFLSSFTDVRTAVMSGSWRITCSLPILLQSNRSCVMNFILFGKRLDLQFQRSNERRSFSLDSRLSLKPSSPMRRSSRGCERCGRDSVIADGRGLSWWSPPSRSRGRSFRLRVQCQICSQFGHLAQRCYCRYHRDGQSSLEAQAPAGRHGAFEFGENKGELERENIILEYGQNWGFSGQNWRPQIQPNEGFNNLTSRGPPAGYKNNRFNLFTQYDNGQNDVAGPNLNYGSYGRNDFGIGRRSLGPQFGGDSLGHPYGGPVSRPRGPSGSVRSRLNNDHILPEPSANCINVDRSWQTVHEAPWHTKPRARVFSVDSSSYDSSQFVGIPIRLLELHASDYSDATTYDSNFNTTDSYVPLPVGSTSWCPDSGATHHVYRDTSNLHGSTPYSGKSSLLMGNGVSTDILSIGSVDIQTREILMWGQVRDGLYHFSAGSDSLLSSVPNAALHVCSPVDDVFSLWHKRLGYPVDNIVKNVLTNYQISFNKNHLDGVYVACQKDFWGPAAVPCEGNLYYVSFIDMTSRFTWVYLISQKSQALECFANQGIIHRVSCPHTSEQNGVAERKHRHIVETGLTLLAQANLPMDYWGYAFCSAVHLINRLPTSVLDGKTPFQSLFGRAPTYDHLRVFGCCCFLYLSPFAKHKLKFRSQPSTFLGYSLRHKGYFCLTLDGKVIVSRHVVFDENRFLFPLSPTNAKLSLNTTTYVPVDIQTREILMWGQVRDGLYHFSASSDSLLSSVPNAALHVCSPVDDVFSLWHKRLGYPVDNIVKNVLTNYQISFNKNHLDGVYVACQKDFWGPAAVPCEGNLYYVSFIDMTSRFTWVYLISQKSQALECFANQGIIHRVSCPHTSEQNGVAERKHRHIVETGLTLLAQANLPMDYWGYAFCSAVHLINRLPTSVLDGKTPFQSLFGRAPTYDHLRVFGCCCFLYLNPFAKHKLEFRSQPSTFLGYSLRHKGYFCLTLDGKVIVSRHVVFDENRFLFPLSPTNAKLSLNTITYVPVVRSIIPNDVRPDPVSATEDSINSPVHNGDRTQYDSSDIYSASQYSSHSRPAVQEEVPSSATFPTEPPTIPLVSTTNTYAMVTRSKAGIFKPKALCADKVEVESCSVEEALAHPDWRLAVQAEFDALLANST